MIEEQQPLPDVPEPDEPYRMPVETMSLRQIDGELRDLFSVAVLYLLVPVFLIAISTTTVVATPFFVRVLPAFALVFVGYWILQRSYVPLYRAEPAMAIEYVKWVSWVGGGIMSTPHARLVALCERREAIKEEKSLES